MLSLEDKLSPRRTATSLPRDMLAIGVLAALAVALPVGWPIRFNTILPWNLLPALGLVLTLRRGAIDLSVWAAAGLGGLVAAGAMNAAASPVWVLVAAGGAGLAMGAVNGVLVAGVRVPSVIVTAVTGLTVIWFAGQFTQGRSVPIAESAYDGWHLTRTAVVPREAEGEQGETSQTGQTGPKVSAKPQAAGEQGAGEQAAGEQGAGETGVGEEGVQEMWLPLRATRALIVGVVYSAVALVLMGILPVDVHRAKSSGRWGRFAALCASGLLSAVGGMCWLLDQPLSAPVPTRLVDDLQIPAAAILAGAAFLGRWRTTLTVFCLPAAMVLAATWRQQVWDLQFAGYSLQLGLLAVMVVGIDASFASAAGGRARRWWLGGPGVAAAVGGVLLVAAAGRYDAHQIRSRFHVGGLMVWSAGVVAAVAAGVLERLRSARVE